VIRLFSYYGSKIRLSGRYPPPEYDTIIEPFAGAAGYSCRYPDRRVILYERDPVIAAVLDYCIRIPGAEIRRLPLLLPGDSIDNCHIPQEAKWLIGLWVNKGSAQPCKQLSKWGRQDWLTRSSCWGPACRARLAIVVDQIKHWVVYNEPWYMSARHRQPATWFFDPPYQQKGKCYKFGSDQIDYEWLGQFCQTRRGQIIVCENEGADWLPFHYLCSRPGVAKAGAHRRITQEAVWLRSNG
jgi:hypothetical protein